MRKWTKIQIITVIAWLAYIVWEMKIYLWARTLPVGDPIIRVDLILIYPVLMILLFASIGQIIKKKKK